MTDRKDGDYSIVEGQRSAAGRALIELPGNDSQDPTPVADIVACLHRELRDLRLEKEDLRFERDRYRASAENFQAKLLDALRDLEKLHILQDGVGRTRREIALLAGEFQARLAHECAAIAADADERHSHELSMLAAELHAANGANLRREVVLLAKEYQARFASLDTHFADPVDQGEPERSKRRWFK